MVETVLTPAHTNPLEPLLNTPFAGAFDHPAPQGPSQRLVRLIVDGLAVPLQIRRHRAHGVPRRVGPVLHVSGLGQVGQDPVGLAMPQAVSGPAEPPAGLWFDMIRGGLAPHKMAPSI